MGADPAGFRLTEAVKYGRLRSIRLPSGWRQA